ncbi:hypothetical protein JX266_014301, partial [Neoarthrinium moseri]
MISFGATSEVLQQNTLAALASQGLAPLAPGAPSMLWRAPLRSETEGQCFAKPIVLDSEDDDDSEYSSEGDGAEEQPGTQSAGHGKVHPPTYHQAAASINSPHRAKPPFEAPRTISAELPPSSSRSPGSATSAAPVTAPGAGARPGTLQASPQGDAAFGQHRQSSEETVISSQPLTRDVNADPPAPYLPQLSTRAIDSSHQEPPPRQDHQADAWNPPQHANVECESTQSQVQAPQTRTNGSDNAVEKRKRPLLPEPSSQRPRSPDTPEPSGIITQAGAEPPERKRQRRSMSERPLVPVAELPTGPRPRTTGAQKGKTKGVSTGMDGLEGAAYPHASGSARHASFHEWPIPGAVLKCVMDNGGTTFQLQFTLGPDKPPFLSLAKPRRRASPCRKPRPSPNTAAVDPNEDNVFEVKRLLARRWKHKFFLEWADGTYSWEPRRNISETLVRDFEESYRG